MTLLVAGKVEQNVWMIADTAITGGNIAFRDRQYRPKIEAAHGSSLVGYAGDHHFGERFIRQCQQVSPGTEALEFLLLRHRECPSVDFAYSYRAGDRGYLFRIADGVAEEVQALHLGDAVAFGQFQEIRHRAERDHAPNALHQFMCCTRGTALVPRSLSDAIAAMLELFAVRQDRGVGGWVVPYLLTEHGSELCPYVYSVTDPITDSLAPGDRIPHGTAEAGGFDLSFTALREGDGMVVYWPQRAAGQIYVRSEIGYDVLTIEGAPAAFIERVKATHGREVDLWFGEASAEPPESITYLRDQHGMPRIAAVRSGRKLSFSWLTSSDYSFQVEDGVLTVSENEKPSADSDPSKPKLSASVEGNGRSAKVMLHKNDEALGDIILDAPAVDDLIASLAQIRTRMREPVPAEITAGTKLEAIVDPAWRTRIAPHPTVLGPLLCLRHPGLGWLSFILPDREARALGQWLTENAKQTSPKVD